jgi:hypothetical protein
MAHVNTASVHIPLWMTSPMSQIGWGRSPSFPTEEGTFFGQLMLTNEYNNLDAYFCNGGGVSDDVVPGRLGQNTGAPFANAYPTEGGTCRGSGHCTMSSTGDGAISCMGRGIQWTKPISVWRGKVLQAETAARTGSAGIISDSANSGGKRVGWIGPTSTVKFSGVPAALAGTNNLVVYYANGDATGTRAFNIKVNGGTAQTKTFPALGDWRKVGQVIVSLSGFTAGNTNTVEFLGSGVYTAPDLDWIEVLAN